MRRTIASITTILLATLCSAAWHGHNPRWRGHDALLVYAPLTSDVADVRGGAGTFARASVSTKQTTETGATVSDLTSGTKAQDTTLGVRIAPQVVNRTPYSEDIDLWTAAGGVVVTKDAATAPDGSATAERIQWTPADTVSVNGTTLCTAHDRVVHSIWLKNRNAGQCTLNVVTSGLVTNTYSGALLTVEDTWTRVYTRANATLTGNCTLMLANAALFSGGAGTCTDVDAWGAQTVVEAAGSLPYCYNATAAATATCAAEVLYIPLVHFPLRRGTLTATVTTGTSTWGYASDRTLLEVGTSGGAGAWVVTYDASADMVTFTAGGVSASIPAPGAPYTSHTLGIAWDAGQGVTIWWDDAVPVKGSGSYVAPSLTGNLYIGSTALGAGQANAWFRDVRVYDSPRVPTRDSTYYATLAGALTPTTGATTPAFTRATAWSCMGSGATSMASVAIDAPCYRSEYGDQVGVRVGSVATNRVRNIVGTVGNTPTGWSSAGAGSPLVTATALYSTTAATYTEAATASQFIYYNTGIGAVASSGSYYVQQDAATTAGDLYFYNTLHLYPIRAGTMTWRRIDWSGTKSNASGNIIIGSSAVAGSTPPTAGVLLLDAPTAELTVQYISPYCDGAAPPTVCGPESVTAAFTAGELPAAQGRLRMMVQPYWASNESGIDRVVFFADADFYLWWDTSERKWVFTAGTQTATSVAQRFTRYSTHQLVVTWNNGAPLTISVDGQTAVASAGNYATATLDATKYIGSSNGGGDEAGAWIGYLEVRGE